MPEVGAETPASDVFSDPSFETRAQNDGTKHVRALATKFHVSRSQIGTEDGGTIVRNVPLLASGTWTDSAVGTPLFYPPETLRAHAEKWTDLSVWSRHMGGSPRDVTDKVGEVVNPRFEDNAIVGDIFLHGATQKSRDSIELVKRKLISFVSVEHVGSEKFNPQTRAYEANSLQFLGLALVNRGACKVCRINEEAPAPVTEPTPELEVDTMTDNKELEAKVDSLTKQLGDVITALKPAEPVKVEVPRELTDAISGIVTRIEKLEKTPTPPVTQAITQVKELGEVETIVTIDKVAKTVRGV